MSALLLATLGGASLEQLVVSAKWHDDQLVAVFADGCRAVVPAAEIGEMTPTSLRLPLRPPYGVMMQRGRKYELLPWDWLRHFGDREFLARTEKRLASHRGALGQRVRAARTDARLSQAELAEGAGVSRATISRLEAGHGGTTFDSIERVAVSLGVDVTALLDDEGSAAKNVGASAAPEKSRMQSRGVGTAKNKAALANLYQETLLGFLDNKGHRLERIVEHLFKAEGWEVDHRSPGGAADVGIDFFLCRRTTGLTTEVVAVEVKDQNSVGRTVVQRLLGATRTQGISRGFVVTRGTIAPTAQREAKASGTIDLMNGEELVRKLILKQVGVRKEGDSYVVDLRELV